MLASVLSFQACDWGLTDKYERILCFHLFLSWVPAINMLTLLSLVLGSHGQLQVRPSRLYCGVWSEDSAEKDLWSCQERLRQKMGQMPGMQKGNDFWKASGENLTRPLALLSLCGRGVPPPLRQFLSALASDTCCAGYLYHHNAKFQF